MMAATATPDPSDTPSSERPAHPPAFRSPAPLASDRHGVLPPSCETLQRDAPGRTSFSVPSATAEAAESKAMTKTLINIALMLGLGLFSAPAFAGGYIVNGHAASSAETRLLAS